MSEEKGGKKSTIEKIFPFKIILWVRSYDCCLFFTYLISRWIIKWSQLYTILWSINHPKIKVIGFGLINNRCLLFADRIFCVFHFLLFFECFWRNLAIMNHDCFKKLMFRPIMKKKIDDRISIGITKIMGNLWWEKRKIIKSRRQKKKNTSIHRNVCRFTHMIFQIMFVILKSHR